MNGASGSTVTWVPKPLYVYVHTVRSKGRVYQYLVIEEYLGQGKRRTILRMRLEDAVRKLLADTQESGAEGAAWCGGWDLNPRRPTPTGLKPAPFGRARAPPRLAYPRCRGAMRLPSSRGSAASRDDRLEG